MYRKLFIALIKLLANWHLPVSNKSKQSLNKWEFKRLTLSTYINKICLHRAAIFSLKPLFVAVEIPLLRAVLEIKIFSIPDAWQF